MSVLRKVIITGLGTGYLPGAPGTWGSAVVCLWVLLQCWLVGTDPWQLTIALLIITGLAMVGCVSLGGWTESHFGRKDPGHCTLDEFAGQALTLVAVPVGTDVQTRLVTVAAGFLLFRFFDILKPPPARMLEALPSGWGVAADDLMAGIYANVFLQCLVRFGAFGAICTRFFAS
ncbi:MAG: phosphatidylglycerophosphatase A [Planctomycetes bacterium]|jgi:phosphatidylglycerophosphatase A|nr:phosphatidylglycerophosphatase A [Phycisphaerae bacterium]NBB95805.1 phosphatidylglycerophosphatase A [Planctomycetota bacterium]